MAKFCNSMDSYQLNEKNMPSYTSVGVSINPTTKKLNDDLGLVALDSQIIGKRGKSSNGLKDTDLEYLYNMIIKNISNLDKLKKNEYMSYLVKFIFKIRDIHDGNGERDIFKKLLLKLNEVNHQLVVDTIPLLVGGYLHNGDLNKNMPYGSFTDLNSIYIMCDNLGTVNSLKLKRAIIIYYKDVLLKDSTADHPSFACKWVPKEKKKINKESKLTLSIAKELFGHNLLPSDLYKSFRKLISKLTDKIKIPENYMSANKWEDLEVKDFPSKSFNKYIKALKYENKDGTLRQPEKLDRIVFREKVLTEQRKALSNPSESKINTSTLYPHDILKKIISSSNSSDIESYNAMFSKFEQQFKDKMNEGVIPPGVVLADVSGSMSGLPMDVCIALSILLSDLFEGPFKNKVLTFETNPQWHTIQGNTLSEKYNSLKKAPWGGSTNFHLALKCILDTAIQNKLSDDDMPKILYVFSDMQWDAACGIYSSRPNKVGFDLIEQQFTEAGYKMPHIVFWNLRATNTYNNNSQQKNTTMMSGFSPNLFKQFMNGNFIEHTPWSSLKELLDSERYKPIQNILQKYYPQ